jgi:hypothetical protein
MGVVIELCAKYPGGRTRIRVADVQAMQLCKSVNFGRLRSYSTVYYTVLHNGIHAGSTDYHSSSTPEVRRSLGVELR